MNNKTQEAAMNAKVAELEAKTGSPDYAYRAKVTGARTAERETSKIMMMQECINYQRDLIRRLINTMNHPLLDENLPTWDDIQQEARAAIAIRNP